MRTAIVWTKWGGVTVRKPQKTSKNAVCTNFGRPYPENGGTCGLASLTDFEPRTKAIQPCIIFPETHAIPGHPQDPPTFYLLRNTPSSYTTTPQDCRFWEFPGSYRTRKFSKSPILLRWNLKFRSLEGSLQIPTEQDFPKPAVESPKRGVGIYFA